MMLRARCLTVAFFHVYLDSPFSRPYCASGRRRCSLINIDGVAGRGDHRATPAKCARRTQQERHGYGPAEHEGRLADALPPLSYSSSLMLFTRWRRATSGFAANSDPHPLPTGPPAARAREPNGDFFRVGVPPSGYNPTPSVRTRQANHPGEGGHGMKGAGGRK